MGKYGKSVIRGREINNNGNHNLMLFQINSFLPKTTWFDWFTDLSEKEELDKGVLVSLFYLHL